MDLDKIGRFLSCERKKKGFTQEQLAEILGTSSKAISKWENGKCLPESSKYEALCRILKITMNDLFAGEKVSEGDENTSVNKMLVSSMERRIYAISGKTKDISFQEFSDAWASMAETYLYLKKIGTKEKAIDHMVKETGLSREECENAYDMYDKIFKDC